MSVWGGLWGGEAMKRFFTSRKKKTHAAHDAEAELFYDMIMILQQPLSMTLVLFICHILSFLSALRYF